MKIILTSCSAPKPDKRAIAKCIASVAIGISDSLSTEIAGIIIAGDAEEIEIDAKNTASTLRDLRKLGIEYEIVE